MRDVPNFRFKRVTKISALLSFIHNFQLKMATHEIGERKQKAFLMDAVAPSVARYLEVFGLESHSVEELLGCVKRRLLGGRVEEQGVVGVGEDAAVGGGESLDL